MRKTPLKAMFKKEKHFLFIILISTVLSFGLTTLSSCSGCKNPQKSTVNQNSPTRSAKIQFFQGVGPSFGCTYIDGNSHNLERVTIQIKTARLRNGGDPNNLSDWEFQNLGAPKIFAKNPQSGQGTINPDGTITMDIPVEGFMSLEVISILDCNECCGFLSNNPSKCPPTRVTGKPVFSGIMQPAAFKNVSGIVAFVPLDFAFCSCEC
jgi:hypothetical protein